MPQGLVEKVELTGRFLRRKIQEYEVLRVEIEVLKNEVDDSVVNNFRKFVR